MNNKNNESEQAAKLRKKAEEIALKKTVQSSEKLDALSPEEIRQTLHELQVHQIELEMQNEELRRVQANLDEAMERYFDLYNLAPVGYFTINEKGFIIEANLTFATLLDVEKNTLIKKPFTRFIFPDDQDVFYNHHKQISKTDTDASQTCELRMVKKDGTKFWVHLESTTVLDSDGEQAYRVVMSDITERKKADEILSQSEEKFRKEFSTLFDDAPVGIALVDKNGIIQEVNNNLLRLLSIRKEELIGSSFVELAPAFGLDITENITDFKNRLIEAPSNKEMTFLNKNNSKTTITVQSSTIKSGDEILGILFILNDITERKKAEDALKENQEKYRLITENTNDLIIITNTDKTFRYVSPSIKSLGYTPDELIGQDSFILLHPEDNISVTSMLKQLIIGRYKPGTSSRFEYRLRDKSGTYHLFETAVKFVKDELGKQMIISISRDITERKEAEEALRESQKRFQALTETTNDFVWEMDANGVYTYCSPQINKLWGYKPEEMIGKTPFDLMIPEDRAHAIQMFHSMSKSPSSFQGLESKNWDKTGRIVIVETSGVPFFDNDGRLRGYRGISRDVTERKKAEEMLRESEGLLRGLFENMTSGAVIYKVINDGSKGSDYIFRNINVAGLRIEGKRKDEVIGKSLFDLRPTIDNYGLIPIFQKVWQTGEPGYFPSTIYVDEKYSNWYENRVFKLPTGEIVAIYDDVTERKKAEENLRKNEEKLRILFDSSPDLIIETDDDGKILALNQMMAKSLGVPSEKLIGKNIFDILPKEIIEERAKIARIALKDGKNQETDDERAGRYFHNIYVPVLHPDGTKTIQTIVRDITEKKKIQDALLESEEKYRILFNDVPVGIGITDKNGRAVDCNQYLADMFGMTCEEFKGYNVKSLYLNPEDRERFQNLLNKEGRVVDWECSFKRKDGTVFSAILSADVIERDGQKLNLTTLRDITERKVAEEKIRKQNVQLKKLDGVKTDFLNTTSHELRTPVASIKGYIQMLLKHTLGDVTEEQKKALEVVLRNTNRLDALIQDILDISRLESGTMRFIPEKTVVIKMVNEVAETMQTSADVKRIQINSDIQKELPELMIDSERVKQVLINLVDNAIKFSPEGSMIFVKARKEKEDIVFEVQDFGRGIPKNKQNKIFERFYQVDSGTDRKFGGIGLGLTISKKIIDTYGGHIWVDSIVGKGSSFKFSLPLQSSKDIEDDLQEISVESP